MKRIGETPWKPEPNERGIAPHGGIPLHGRWSPANEWGVESMRIFPGSESVLAIRASRCRGNNVFLRRRERNAKSESSKGVRMEQATIDLDRVIRHFIDACLGGRKSLVNQPIHHGYSEPLPEMPADLVAVQYRVIENVRDRVRTLCETY
jgi:hypothetical protein